MYPKITPIKTAALPAKTKHSHKSTAYGNTKVFKHFKVVKHSKTI